MQEVRKNVNLVYNNVGFEKFTNPEAKDENVQKLNVFCDKSLSNSESIKVKIIEDKLHYNMFFMGAKLLRENSQRIVSFFDDQQVLPKCYLMKSECNLQLENDLHVIFVNSERKYYGSSILEKNIEKVSIWAIEGKKELKANNSQRGANNAKYSLYLLRKISSEFTIDSGFVNSRQLEQSLSNFASDCRCLGYIGDFIFSNDFLTPICRSQQILIQHLECLKSHTFSKDEDLYEDIDPYKFKCRICKEGNENQDPESLTRKILNLPPTHIETRHCVLKGALKFNIYQTASIRWGGIADLYLEEDKHTWMTRDPEGLDYASLRCNVCHSIIGVVQRIDGKKTKVPIEDVREENFWGFDNIEWNAEKFEVGMFVDDVFVYEDDIR